MTKTQNKIKAALKEEKLERRTELPPLLHSFLQRWQQELLMEAVDGANIGEDPLNHVAGKGGAGPSFLQEPGTENLQNMEVRVRPDASHHRGEVQTGFHGNRMANRENALLRLSTCLISYPQLT